MSNKNILNVLFLLCLVGLVQVVSAQDLEGISKQKPFKISGGVGLNYTSTSTNDSNRIPMPAFWGANLNLNVSVYGISIPVTAVFTNGKVSMNHAFNQFGMSPQYKWVTLHVGYRQFSYSPFSVSGQTLLGGGIELRPWKFRLGFFGGRLRKAIEIDTTSLFEQNIPGSYPLNISTENGNNYYSPQVSFSRVAWGGKVGFGKETNFVDLIFFKAHDITSSLAIQSKALEIRPEENVVLGINVYQRLFKHFSFGINSAASIYTYDTNASALITDIPFGNLANNLITIRSTTQLQWAGEATLNINYPKFNLLTSYKRAEPNYKSMGITSFLNDLNLITIQPSWTLFKQKVRFSNVFQFQSDNLNNYKQLTTSRSLLSSSVSFNLSNQFGTDFNYNGTSITQEKTTGQSSSSLQLSQKSNSVTVSPRYIFNTINYSDVISLVGSLTSIKNHQINSTDNNISNTYFTLNNTLSLVKGSWSVNSGGNFNSAITSQNKLLSYGFIAGISKSMLNNSFTLSNNNTILWNKLDGKNNGTTVSIDLNGVYNFLKRNTLNIGFSYLYSPANNIYNIQEFKQKRLMISYQYNF